MEIQVDCMKIELDEDGLVAITLAKGQKEEVKCHFTKGEAHALAVFLELAAGEAE